MYGAPGISPRTEVFCARFSNDGFDAAYLVGRDFHGAWRASKRMQTMSRPTTCLHGELFGQDLQDGIRHLHERMSGQVITGMISEAAIALSVLLIALAFESRELVGQLIEQALYRPTWRARRLRAFARPTTRRTC